MKRSSASAGLTPGRGRVCRSPHAARAFVDEVGYPIVAKPDAGVDAVATFRLDSDAASPARPMEALFIDKGIPGFPHYWATT